METDSLVAATFKPMVDRLAVLNATLEVLKCVKSNRSESLKLIKELAEKTSVMRANLEELKQLLQQRKALREELKVYEIEMSHLLYKLDELDKNYANERALSTDGIYFLNVPSPVASVTHSFENEKVESCSYDFSPIQLSVAPPPSSKNFKLHSLHFEMVDVLYLTENDFKTVPKYMAGRLTLEAINNFVDIFNGALEKKYNLLSKPKSTLKVHELELQRKYKRQQTVELKGKSFITEEDLAQAHNRKTLEKKTYNFLSILRHTKRIGRYVDDGVTVYTVCTPERY